MRTADASLRNTLVHEPVAICGVTRAEVLHGARDDRNRRNIVAALDMFQQLPIPDSLWDSVGDNLRALRAGGITVPLADVIIAAVAIEHDVQLWTLDNQFALMQPILTNLRLYEPAA